MTSPLKGVDAAQYGHLLGVVQGSNAYGPTAGIKRAAYMAVCCILAEAGLYMYANNNVPTSFNYPYERVGNDHASVGMFQQQVGPSYAKPGTSTVSDTTWGTPAQLMDSVYSTEKFLSVLVLQSDWNTSTLPWVNIQTVQGSAYDGNPRPANNYSSEYGGNYHAQWDRAVQLVDAVWGESPSGGGTVDEDLNMDDNHFKDLVRSVLNEGTAPGQTSWASTNKALLGGVQGLTNLINRLSQQVSDFQAMITFGDGRDVSAGSDTHPWNLKNIWNKVSGL
jgi:hypothetical protein